MQKSKLEKYETDNVKILKKLWIDASRLVKQKSFYDLRQMLEGQAYYYFKQISEVNLIDVIVRVAGKTS